MNLRDLRYLVALADLRHFGKAADACFVSQPTLSTQIRKLEDELGVALVERAPRKVMLTAVGQDVVQRARRIVADVEQMKEAARRSRDPESGSLRLGVFPTLGPYLLPHVVPQLRERFPQLELLLVEEKSDVLLQSLREGKLDAALLALPVHDEQLHAEFLFEEPFVFAAPVRHPLAAQDSLAMSQISDETLLLLEDGHCLREQALAALMPLEPRLTGDQTQVMDHVFSLAFPRLDSEALMVGLKDLVAISNGSACTSSRYTPSHVLKAMGLDDDQASGCVRISWCHLTPPTDWAAVAARIRSLR